MRKQNSQVKKGKFPHVSSQLNLKCVPQEHLSTHHHHLPSSWSTFSFLKWLGKNLDPYDMKSPPWACRKNILKSEVFSCFLFFIYFGEEKHSLGTEIYHSTALRKLNMKYRTFLSHRQIYNMFNYKTQRDKK